MKKIAIIALLTILVFATCKKKNNNNTTYTPTCVGTKSFTSDVFPLIKSKCWRCHNNLANYSQVQALSSTIKDMVSSGVMPKDETLTSAQKDIIVCWIEAGAPNN